MPLLLVDKAVGRLTDTRIIAILKQPEAWAVLSTEAQQQIYCKLPAVYHVRTGARLAVDTSIHPLQHDVYGEAVKDFIVYIETMVELGANRKVWQDEAREATVERSRGSYNNSKDAEREDYWGQKSDPSPITREIARHGEVKLGRDLVEDTLDVVHAEEDGTEGSTRAIGKRQSEPLQVLLQHEQLQDEQSLHEQSKKEQLRQE